MLVATILHWLITGFVFLFILTVLVLLHEAGHFFVARFFNIKVEEFGFGFPPRAWGKKVGETLYSINWLPIGGFVKLFGEDDAGAGKVSLPGKNQESRNKNLDTSRAFFARPAWQRALVVFAGVVMNTLLAFLIFYIFLIVSGFKTNIVLLGSAPHFVGVETTVIPKGVMIGTVSRHSPAEAIGIKTPATVISVNGTKISSTGAFIKIVNQNKGKDIVLSWQNTADGSIHTAHVTPRLNAPKNQGSLGVSLSDSPYALAILDYKSPIQKVLSGINHSINMLIYTVATFVSLIQTSVKQHSVGPVSQGFSGPVGIVSVVSLILSIGSIKETILQLLNLAGLLSISLAFFNVLPIPALDGGRLFFIIIEMVIGKKLNPKFEAYANNIGMAILLGLILLITLKDIRQFIFHQ